MINGCKALIRLALIRLVTCVDQKNRPMDAPKHTPAGAHSKNFSQVKFCFCIASAYEPKQGTPIHERHHAILSPCTSDSEVITEAIAIRM